MSKKEREILNGQYDKEGKIIEADYDDIYVDNTNDNITPIISIDKDLDNINMDTDEILEDTTAIDDRTQSMDKKLWILITLWLLDKIILLTMFLIFNK